MTTTLNPTQLHSIFQDRAIFPEDSRYESAKTIFYGGMATHPQVIIQVKTAEEVQQVVKLAKETGLDLAIHSGGHSTAGFSTCDGIVLDLSLMKNLEINEREQTAWAEAGMTTGEYTRIVGEKGFVTGFGDTGSVGIGGITVSGGVGFFVRKWGLAIDQLLAIEIVTADGQLLKADAQKHPDLFWAVREGGGNFGVVTRFQFQLHRLPQVYGGMLVLPAEPKVVTGFVQAAKQASKELSTIFNVMSAPPMPFLPKELHGKMICLAMMVWAGDEESGKAALAPFRALATPLTDMVKPIEYREMFPPEGGDFHPTAVSHTMFINDVDETLAEQIIQKLASSDAPMRATQLRVLGGTFAEVPTDATAFAHRHSQIMVNVAAFYNGESERDAKLLWVRDLAQTLYQGDTGAYIGFISKDELNRIDDAYPAKTKERLAKVKRQFDPTNLFHLNLNIQE
jgi:FAD/FMN-containing dehydrogenase